MTPPLRVEPEWSNQLYYVVKDSTGLVVAQGDKGMCERIAAGRPALLGQGSLFDVDR